MPPENDLSPSDAANVAALGATRLGADPNAMPQGEANAASAAPQAGQTQTPQADGTAAPSALDAGQTQGAPQTEADAQDLPPMKYKINMNGEDRELTPEQISGTFDRYAKQVQVNDAMRPVTNLYLQAAKDNPGLTPEKFAQTLLKMANTPNPEMGGQDQRPNQQGQPGKTAEEISAEFEQWEKDNAATLPPGYKDMMTANQGLQQGMSQMMKMMQQVLGRSQGQLDAAGQVAQGAQGQAVNNAKNRIANNLSSVQQKLGLPDNAEQDFMMFAAERGYTMEDFLDPVLTLKVAQDFKNGMQSGEVERLRQVAQRRQAFTGTAPTQPGAGAGTAPAEDANLTALVNRKLG